MNDPKRKRKAAQMLARGATKAEVGRVVGVSRPTVSRWANSDEVKAWVEAEAQRYLESLPDALAISRNLLQAGKNESEKLLAEKGGDVDHKVLGMGVRESESMRKSIGVLPAQHQSVLIQNIYSDHRGSILSPALEALLRAQSKDSEVIEVEPEEEG